MSDKKYYDSKAISTDKWEIYGIALMLDGWELVATKGDQTYIRKELTAANGEAK